MNVVKPSSMVKFSNLIFIINFSLVQVKFV